MDPIFMGLDGIWLTGCQMKYLPQNHKAYTLQKTQFSFNLTSDATKRNITRPFFPTVSINCYKLLWATGKQIL